MFSYVSSFLIFLAIFISEVMPSKNLIPEILFYDENSHMYLYNTYRALPFLLAELYQEINIPLLSQIDEGSKEMDVSQPDSSDGEKQERITTIDSYESDDSSDFDYDDDTVYYNEDNVSVCIFHYN